MLSLASEKEEGERKICSWPTFGQFEEAYISCYPSI